MVTFHKYLERIPFVTLNDNLFINVYMPYFKSLSDIDNLRSLFQITLEISSEIEITISMSPDHKIIWGGDFNVTFASSSAAFVLINQFMCKYNLEPVKSDLSSYVKIVNYTYRHKTLGFQSYIDYFIINANLNCTVFGFDIIDCGANLSDHNPVMLEVFRDILKLKNDLL